MMPTTPIKQLTSREMISLGNPTWSPEEKEAVVEYLADQSFHWMSSTGMRTKDSRTGATLPWYPDTMADDEGHYWLITLPYYIKEYDTLVPRDYIDFVMAKHESGWRPTVPIRGFSY